MALRRPAWRSHRFIVIVSIEERPSERKTISVLLLTEIVLPETSEKPWLQAQSYLISGARYQPFGNFLILGHKQCVELLQYWLYKDLFRKRI